MTIPLRPSPEKPIERLCPLRQHVTQRQLDEKRAALLNDEVWKGLDKECRALLNVSTAIKTKKKRKAVCTKRGKMQRNIEDQFEQQLQAAETHCKAALEVMDQSSSKLIYDHVCSVLEDLVEKTRQEVMVPGNIIAVKSSTNGKKRLCLSPFSKSILRKWFDDHFHHPYPSEEEKESLSRQAEISVDQVNNWFINTRVRAWKPKVKAILNQDAAGNSTELEAMMDKIQAPYQETSSLYR